MDTDKKKFCTSCNAEIMPGSVFCEYCGASQEKRTEPGPQKKIPETPRSGHDTFRLPGIDVKPNLGEAISKGWDILMSDIAGTLLVMLAFFILSLVAAFIPLIGTLAFFALQVGLFGWADLRRRGKLAGVESMLNIATSRFMDSVLLALIFLIISLIAALPIWVGYFTLIWSIIGAVFSGISSSGSSPQISPLLFITGPAMFGLAVIWSMLFGFIGAPILASLQAMSFWAVANGKPFDDSLRWAWARVKADFVNWWLIGLVLTFLSGIGGLACYVGVFITYPLSIIAWTVLISDESGPGDEDDK
ncbi:MAG: hypothetical protein NTY09_06810 [bacterium]|nr:hypothetical protein [bacterium]